MISLEDRRRLASTLFTFDLLKNNINVKELKDRLIINTNRYTTRTRKFLKEENHRTDFAYFDVVSTAIRNFNLVASLFDTNCSKKTFRNRIMIQIYISYGFISQSK